MQTFTLFELNEHIRRVLALNFHEPLWITAEIAQVGQSKGHFYFDLVQKNADSDSADMLAQAQAVLWARDYQRLRKTLGNHLDELLREGLELKMRVRVDYHERYGLKLLLDDLDPAYTFGQLELQRRQTVEQLRREGLLDQNRSLPLPQVLQRIAIISAEGAAGFQDFRQHLAQNVFGYRFDCRFFSAAVQGKNVESEISAALANIANAGVFDCATILRGGGARLELAAFDQIGLCRAVARMPLPVLAGIGHDVDETVLDLVAHTALKTPTAVADFLVQHNLLFENAVLRQAAAIQQVAAFQLKTHAFELKNMESTLHWTTQTVLRTQHQNLQNLAANLPVLALRACNKARENLLQIEAICQALHPDSVLQRGFSITTHKGKIVRNAAELQAGDILETRLKDGEIRSVIE